MKYTIRYQYGTYTGEEVIYAEDRDQATARLWKRLKSFMTLGMAYQSAEVISVEDEDEDGEE